MSDYGSIVERAHRASAAISQLEREMERAPGSRALRMNMLAMRKLARQAEADLLQVAQVKHVEVCNYRLLPESGRRYGLPHVSKSLLEYQNLFSQIYDAQKNGKKEIARALARKQPKKARYNLLIPTADH